jgi:phosphoribosylglycinamide formyltransferase 1
LRIGIFISGTGTNMDALISAHAQGKIECVEKIAFVFSDRKNAPGIEKANAAGIRTVVLPKKAGEEKGDYENRILNAIESYKVDLIVLAGFMKILSSVFLNGFGGKIINIHPSILPAFKGVDAQKQAFDYGVKISGCSVHFVDDTLDGGPIILQTVVERSENDTLDTFKNKILKQEHDLLVSSVSIVAADNYEIRDRYVLIKRRK